MKSIYLALIFLMLFGCVSETAKKHLDFGAFHMETPHDWTKFKLQGIDSYVGGITNGEDTLRFDYGWYSSDFGRENPDLHRYSHDTINGKSALIIRPVLPGQGRIGIYIDKAKGKNRFNLVGSNIKNETVVLEIFKSIYFEGSQITTVSENFGENFEPHTQERRNKNLFENTCGSCHLLNDKYSLGPGLQNLTRSKFDYWLTDSLPLPDSTNTTFVAGPTFHRNIGQSLTMKKKEMLRSLFQRDSLLFQPLNKSDKI